MLSRYVVDVPVRVDSEEKRILFSTRSQAFSLLSNEQYEFLRNNQYDSLPESLNSELREKLIITENHAEELKAVTDLIVEESESSKSMTVTIMPTHACQLNCSYCGQKKDLKFISTEKQDRILERIALKLKENGKKILSVTWFGGEPLLALKEASLLNEKIKNLATKLSVQYFSTIVTNGVLLNQDNLSKLISDFNTKNIEITLDGTEAIHNKTRFFKNGSGSYQKIIENLKNIDSSILKKISLRIRVNLTEGNKDNVLVLLQELKELGLCEHIIFYVAMVHDWGDHNQRERFCSSIDSFSEIDINVLSFLIANNFRYRLIPRNPSPTCIATSTDGELYDAEGNVYQCSEYANVSTSKKNYVKETVVESSDFSRQENFSSFYSDITLEKYDCHKCEILPLCKGMCPKSWVEGNAPCPIWKHTIKERVLLNYLLTK